MLLPVTNLIVTAMPMSMIIDMLDEKEWHCQKRLDCCLGRRRIENDDG